MLLYGGVQREVDIVRIVHPDPVLVVVIRRVVVDGNPAGDREVDPVPGVVERRVPGNIVMVRVQQEDSILPVVAHRVVTSSFQLDPLTSHHPVPPVTADLVLGYVVPITALSKQDPVLVVPPGVLLNTVLFEEPERVMRSPCCGSQTLLTREVQFEFVRLIPESPL